ncbi:MAG: LysR substrate-binding domain-containing protein [Thermoleophilaceae bacterium]
MLDVRRMKVLREVAAQGSFSAAAEALSFTQSAVSQQVAALERETGAKLVERGPRGIRLTDAGEAIVRHTDAVLARLNDAEEELQAIAGLRGGRLRLAGFQSAGATLVPRAVAIFHERHPEVELSMTEAEPENAVPLLKTGDVDIVFTMDWAKRPEPPDPALEYVELVDDPYDVVLRKGHRLAGAKRVKLADLAGEPLINPTSRCECNRVIQQACHDAGFEPNIVFRTDENMAAQAFVASGVGVALLPRLACEPLHPAVIVRRLDQGAPVRRVQAARLAAGYRSPASEAMMQILQDVAEEFREAELEAVG